MKIIQFCSCTNNFCWFHRIHNLVHVSCNLKIRKKKMNRNEEINKIFLLPSKMKKNFFFSSFCCCLTWVELNVECWRETLRSVLEKITGKSRKKISFLCCRLIFLSFSSSSGRSDVSGEFISFSHH